MNNVIHLKPRTKPRTQIPSARYLADHPNEANVMKGTCCDCAGPTKALTYAEILAIKTDLGMGSDDDFADCCALCAEKYLPPNAGFPEVA